MTVDQGLEEGDSEREGSTTIFLNASVLWTWLWLKIYHVLVSPKSEQH